MKATAKQIFNTISRTLNARVNSVSSIGDYISETTLNIVEAERTSISKIVGGSSLAYKIISSQKVGKPFSDKQLFVIAYELERNDSYAEQIAAEQAADKRAHDTKMNEHKSKLSTNKSNSQSVLDCVKANGRLLKDYYAFVKATKKFAREFYSKKYTMDSVNAFLAA